MTLGIRLLVPMDGSERTERIAELAASLAGSNGATVRLASVVTADLEVAARERYLRAVAESLDAPVDVVVKVGSKVETELELLMDDRTSLVAATGATLAPHSGHIGSVTERLLRASTRPAVVVGPNARPSVEGVEKVLAALDGSELAERGVLPASDLAIAIGAHLWLVTVATPEQVASAAAIGPVIESSYLRRMAGDLAPERTADYEVLHGRDPAHSIIDFAGEDDVIALTTHGRSGLQRLTLGSVTTEVVRSARRPTLVIPPLFELSTTSPSERSAP